MCTGFVKKGKDTIYGFNLDIDPAVWNFNVYHTKDYFTVEIKVGHTLYFTHGVNKEGHFSNVPYMNGGDLGKFQMIKNRERVDLLTNRFIRNQYSMEDVEAILKTKTLVNIPGGSMHSLLTCVDGPIYLIEPGLGYQEIKENYAVISNFPILKQPDHFEPWFGKERYDIAQAILQKSTDDFNAQDGIELLKQVKQDGLWSTKVSFVYSVNEKKVYYCLNGDFDHLQIHSFN
jgi:hypothetical protein